MTRQQKRYRLRKALWPHQAYALSELRACLIAGKMRPIIQMATGAGKTLAAAIIIAEFEEEGLRVAFVVDRLSLIDQTVRAFANEGILRVGVIQGNHELTNPHAPIQICSAQTLLRRELSDVDCVIVDEAHSRHDVLYEWMAARPDIWFVGLSATPWAKGLGLHWDHLIVGATTRQLAKQKFLAPYVIFAPHTPDLKGVKTVAGDYHDGQLAKRINTSKIVGDVVDTWKRLGDDRPTLAYGVRRDHAEHIQQRFNEAGIPFGYIDGSTPRQERERIFEQLRSGEIKGISSCGALTTGLDLPLVSCLIDAKPTQSKIQAMQVWGRGRRTAPNKKNLIILDHAGNAQRLGLPDDIHYDRLDTSGPGEKPNIDEERGEAAEPLPRLCEMCSAVLPARSHTCDQCGHVRTALTKVIHAEGELVEVGSTEEPPPPLKVVTDEERQKFYRELLWIITERSGNIGRAFHLCKEKFPGEKPPPWAWRSLAPLPASLQTRNWFRHRDIKRAKSQSPVPAPARPEPAPPPPPPQSPGNVVQLFADTPADDWAMRDEARNLADRVLAGDYVTRADASSDDVWIRARMSAAGVMGNRNVRRVQELGPKAAASSLAVERELVRRTFGGQA